MRKDFEEYNQKDENKLARQIVANLGWRWLFARRLYQNYLLNYPAGNPLNDLYTRHNEAWNAFESSRRILYGVEV